MTIGYLLDANVLVALTHAQHVHHRVAHEWFGSVTRWATTPLTEIALVRLLLNPIVVGHAISPGQALGVLRQIRALPGHEWLPDGSTLTEPHFTMTLGGYRQVTEFHLLNLSASTGWVLATFDAKLSHALEAADRHHVHVVA